MQSIEYKRLPKHIGIIPDGNRRWATHNNKDKHEGYQFGINPGVALYEKCLGLGIQELTFYGFTQDNAKRPKVQTQAFQTACVDAVMALTHKDANISVIGNTHSKVFPDELIDFANKRVPFGKGLMNINFLINYGWQWDLEYASSNKNEKHFYDKIASSDISRMDLIIRWGGRRRLSGFLPVQSVYSDFYIVDELWPDYQDDHLYQALDWYQSQDVTLGG
ncbi:undecaprenyl diphosphate synthase [Natranaerovirga hydrolytica]|uniref:Undecaprenyl diphosphate synthase n=1 Tax=Natranaerovirga hydrolytica TaxID=680378 RepID=A0A4R1MZ83_9FIRM|nr:undecaprenyl diphosphate synthase family protein [Natranaerovirga hydrolytica]TCK98576.1 undecaprenyl diphosphate synthase [Natranaerovirga hydrolytica]